MSTPPSASSARAEVRQVAPKLTELTETVVYGDVRERPGLSNRDRTGLHDSGPVWVAGPSPHETFFRNTSPV